MAIGHLSDSGNLNINKHLFHYLRRGNLKHDTNREKASRTSPCIYIFRSPPMDVEKIFFLLIIIFCSADKIKEKET